MNSSSKQLKWMYSTIYQQYKDQQSPIPQFVIYGIILFGISSFGLLANFCLIYVTVKSKNLRGTSNFLLALTAFYEMLHQIGHFLEFGVSISGLNFVDYGVAAKFFTVPIFGLSGAILTTLFTGLDRLIALLFINWQFNGKKLWLYLGIMSTVSTMFALYNVLCIEIEAGSSEYSDVKIPGSLGDIFISNSALSLTTDIMALNVLTIVIYASTAIMVRIRTAATISASANPWNRRIFRSLLAIVILNLGGYFCIAIFIGVTMQFPDIVNNPMAYWRVAQIMGIFLNLSASSNGPILLMTSSDYRNAFQSEMSKLFKNGNSVTPFQN